MKLDLTSLQDALAALEKSLRFLSSEMAENVDLREQFRNSAIQCFEFTHELAFRMMKRQLERGVRGGPGERGSGLRKKARRGRTRGNLKGPARQEYPGAQAL